MRFLDQTLPTIAADLALDEALLCAADEDDPGAGPVLRLWEPEALAVVLGATSRIGADVHRDACRADGVPIFRRSSGGGTVVVGPGALNATIVLSAAPGLGAVDVAHRYVLERTAAAIRAFVPDVAVLGLGDLTIAGRKCAGSAQRRLRRFFFVHLTILYRFPLDRIGRYLPPPGRQPAYRDGRSHEDFVCNLGLARAALVEAIRSAWLDPGQPPEPASMPEDRVAELVASKFADPAWIERL